MGPESNVKLVGHVSESSFELYAKASGLINIHIA